MGKHNIFDEDTVCEVFYLLLLSAFFGKALVLCPLDMQKDQHLRRFLLLSLRKRGLVFRHSGILGSPNQFRLVPVASRSMALCGFLPLRLVFLVISNELFIGSRPAGRT